MDKQVISKFRFVDYKFSSLNLELNEDYDASNVVGDESLEVSVGINIKLSAAVDKAIIELKFSIFEDDIDNKYPYKINVNMIGYFEIEDPGTEDKVTHLCKLNGTAIMFPYIRSAITDLTKVSNVNPLILPAINIYKLIEK